MDENRPNIAKQIKKSIARKASDTQNLITVTSAQLDHSVRNYISESEDAIYAGMDRTRELLQEFILNEAAGIQGNQNEIHEKLREHLKNIDRNESDTQDLITAEGARLDLVICKRISESEDAVCDCIRKELEQLHKAQSELITEIQRTQDNMQGILGLMHSMAKAVKQLEEKKEKE